MYRVAYRGLQAYAFLRRPEVRGASVAVLDGGRVLLVRHTYGDRGRWDMPGGWVRSGEDPRAAARREAQEELGIDVEPEPRVELVGGWDFKREHLFGFAAPWPGGRGTYDPVELAEVAFWPLDALPQRLGPQAREVLATMFAGGDA